MTKQRWFQPVVSLVLVSALLVAVLITAQAAANAYIVPTATLQVAADGGLTTIFGMSPRALQILR